MTALWGHLAGTPGVRALVADRVYPLVVPQDVAMPAVAYQKVNSERIGVHGTSGGPGFGVAGWARTRVQVTCHAEEYADARALADAVRTGLDGFRGVMNDEVRVDGCRVENEVDGYNQVAGYATVRVDLVMVHRE